MTVKGLNITPLDRLFAQGHRPVARFVPEFGETPPSEWHRVDRVDEVTTQDGDLDVRFTYFFPSTIPISGAAVYIAFSIPHGYSECQDLLASYDEKLASPEHANPLGIYYHRDLAIRTADGRRIDLLTVTSAPTSDTPDYVADAGSGGEEDSPPADSAPSLDVGDAGLLVPKASELNANKPEQDDGSPEYEPTLPGLFPATTVAKARLGDSLQSKNRARVFPGKPVFFVSSRVNPMETPSSHMFNGLLEFLLGSDPRAKAAREKWVFKLMPMLNPDGVARGYQKSNSKGENLNKCYTEPSQTLHPGVYAAKMIATHHAGNKTLEYYVDLHANAAKQGVCVLGNALDGARQVDNVVFARLMDLYTKHLDYSGCGFSERNMFSTDPKAKDNVSKLGNGRVGVFLATDLLHCYTIECNYNTDKQRSDDDGAAAAAAAAAAGLRDDGDGGGDGEDPEGKEGEQLFYSIPHFAEMGEAIIHAALDQAGIEMGSKLATPVSDALENHRHEVASLILEARKRAARPGAKPSRSEVMKKVSRMPMPKRVRDALKAAGTSTNTAARGKGKRGLAAKRRMVNSVKAISRLKANARKHGGCLILPSAGNTPGSSRASSSRSDRSDMSVDGGKSASSSSSRAHRGAGAGAAAGAVLTAGGRSKLSPASRSKSTARVSETPTLPSLSSAAHQSGPRRNSDEKSWRQQKVGHRRKKRSPEEEKRLAQKRDAIKAALKAKLAARGGEDSEDTTDSESDS